MNRNISSLDQAVAEKCRELLKICRERGLQLRVISTLRTEDEQRALYAQGREHVSAVNALREVAGLPPIKESHNRVVTSTPVSVHQFGCAFDIVLTREGVPHWDTTRDINDNSVPDYIEAGRIGESLGLTWGGRWSSRDLVHYELRVAPLTTVRAALQAGERVPEFRKA